MKENQMFLILAGLSVMIWITIICLAPHQTSSVPVSEPNPEVVAAHFAMAVCKDTGGEMLVTEFNSKTGLTMNCFYPERDVIEMAQSQFQDL